MNNNLGIYRGPTRNIFCPTGEGGGVDASCGNPNKTDPAPINEKEITKKTIYELPKTIIYHGTMYRGQSKDESSDTIHEGQSWTPELKVARMFSDGKVVKTEVKLKLYNTATYGSTSRNRKEELLAQGYDGFITDIAPDMGGMNSAHEVRLFKSLPVVKPPKA